MNEEYDVIVDWKDSPLEVISQVNFALSQHGVNYKFAFVECDMDDDNYRIALREEKTK